MREYKAAIVDDSRDYRERVKVVLQSIAKENDKTISCEEFSRAETLLYELEDGTFYDIYILDIEMPKIDGMELAKRIRKYKADSCIIFVTSYSKYALESYEIDAYQYILKGKLAERFPKVLQKFFREKEEEDDVNYYIISTDYRVERFRCKDIIWIYKEDKYLVFVTKEKTYKQRATLNEVYQKLPQEEFIFVERGIIVNMYHVYGMKGNEIELSNGRVLTASRAQAKKVRESIVRYWGSRL